MRAAVGGTRCCTGPGPFRVLRVFRGNNLLPSSFALLFFFFFYCTVETVTSMSESGIQALMIHIWS